MLRLNIKYKESALPNGLRVITASGNSPVVDVELWTRTGYRYEKPDELGYAHLLEHMLLTGTKKRPNTYALNLEIESRGGYFNATTSQNFVSYEIQMMKEDVEFMCDILSDIIFNSKLDSKQLEREKGVILQELRQKQEDNSQFFGRFSLEKIFPNHPISKNILNTEKSTLEATSERLRTYLKRNYRPDQSALIMAGNIKHSEAIKLAQKYFGKWEKTKRPFDSCLKPATKAPKYAYFEKKDLRQTKMNIGFYTEPLKDLKNSATWTMLSNFLAFGSTSILRTELREKRGLVYSVNAGRVVHWDAGVFGIFASTEKPEEALMVIKNVLKNIPQRLTKKEFEKTKKQTIASFLRYISKPGNQSLELGEDFILRNKIVTPENWLKHLNSVKRKDVIDVFKKNIANQKPILVCMGSKKIKNNW